MKLKDIKGIGPKIETILKDNGIFSISQILYTIPKHYIEYKISEFSYENPFNIKCVVIDDVKLQKLKNVSKVSFNVSYEGIPFSVSCFNMNFLSKTVHIGDELVICGEYNKDYKQIVASKVFHLNEYKEGILPDYSIEGIPNPLFQKIVIECMNYYDEKKEIIPVSYFKKYNYMCGRELLNAIHNPKNIEESTNALDSLKYYELLTFLIKLYITRMNISSNHKNPKLYNITKVKDFIRDGIKFELTDDQKQATNEIFKYFNSTETMNMLVEGDTGCGKTIVAVISAYAMATAGIQTAVIVPTEALALQHYNSFSEYLSGFGVNIKLLTSSTKTKERNEILNDLKDGSINVLIGTHSLLSDEVVFNNLGFIVYDEQHKFGVEQRKKLREKGINPDILYMTATPIPRTLALTMFNDLEIRKIKTMPKGRKKVYTNIYTYKDYLKVLEFVKSEINDGRQAYFVASCIEDNEESSLTSVLRIKNDLENYYKNFKIGLLHGKLNSVEKEEVINKFINHEIDILASTSVIEVGINNTNASVMVIIDANRFGLSTLHQLRGRVGRGNYEGYTFLMVEKKSDMEKLQILKETQDGFLISEEDLKQRGAGDFLGTEQSGVMKFRYADFNRDTEILNYAIKDANELIKQENILNYYQSLLKNDQFD